MRFTHVVRTLALCSLLATTVLVYGQEQREEPRRAPEPSPEAAQPPAQDETKAPRQEEAKPEKQNENQKGEDKAAKQGNNKDAKRNDSARSGQQTQHAANQRGGRIPDEKFRASFGRQHKFKVQTTTVNGQPGLQYGGYSFVIVDAWPGGWAYTDDCYIDYIDGEYFLFDLFHPGVQVALLVVL